MTNVTIPLKRKRIIHDYLLRYGCRPTSKGFNVLADVINIAADCPEHSCKELFEEYVLRKADDEPKANAWRTPYKAARYCYVNSVADVAGVYEFIKICSVSVEDIKEA